MEHPRGGPRVRRNPTSAQPPTNQQQNKPISSPLSTAQNTNKKTGHKVNLWWTQWNDLLIDKCIDQRYPWVVGLVFATAILSFSIHFFFFFFNPSAASTTTYHYSFFLFVRLLGFTFLLSFLSIRSQIFGLIGTNGILPIRKTLHALLLHKLGSSSASSSSSSSSSSTNDKRHELSLKQWGWLLLNLPTLFWILPLSRTISASPPPPFESIHTTLPFKRLLERCLLALASLNEDQLLAAVCWCGTVSSLMVVLVPVGWVVVPCLMAAWFLFLSLKVVGREFFALQFDSLLLEAAFLVIVETLLQQSRGLMEHTAASHTVHWLLVWLTFRLMFGSGIVKLLTKDPAWRDGTALNYHYWSQPLPNLFSFYAYHLLPNRAHRVCVYFHFLVELFAPILCLFPWTSVGGALLVFSLQVGIFATGYYGTFNLLSGFLVVTVVPDTFWPTFVKEIVDEWWSRFNFAPLPSTSSSFSFYLEDPLRWIVEWTCLAFALLFVLFILINSLGPFADLSKGRIVLWKGWHKWSCHRYLKLWSMVNYYGLFGRMTKQRLEVIIEGSHDWKHWHEYRFLYKPSGGPSLHLQKEDKGANEQCMKKWSKLWWGHLPRLDWRLWFCQFVSLSPAASMRMAWLNSFLRELLRGSREVNALLLSDDENGIDNINNPPKIIRVSLYEYRFADLTSSSERMKKDVKESGKKRTVSRKEKEKEEKEKGEGWDWKGMEEEEETEDEKEERRKRAESEWEVCGEGWWKRRYARRFCPPVTLNEQGKLVFLTLPRSSSSSASSSTSSSSRK
ncbi:Lipase maturation factor [Balamuthia mandrillaris]